MISMVTGALICFVMTLSVAINGSRLQTPTAGLLARPGMYTLCIFSIWVDLMGSEANEFNDRRTRLYNKKLYRNEFCKIKMQIREINQVWNSRETHHPTSGVFPSNSFTFMFSLMVRPAARCVCEIQKLVSNRKHF